LYIKIILVSIDSPVNGIPAKIGIGILGLIRNKSCRGKKARKLFDVCGNTDKIFIMAKTREQKKKILEELIKNLSEAKTVVFTTYQGLTMPDLKSFRSQLETLGKIKYQVVMNTLARIALQKTKIGGAKDYKFSGPIAFAFGFDDELAPIKGAYSFAKTNDKLKVIGAIFEKNIIDEKSVKEISLLPSKKDLLAKIVSILQGPTNGFVNVLQGNIRGLLYTLRAVSEK